MYDLVVGVLGLAIIPIALLALYGFATRILAGIIRPNCITNSVMGSTLGIIVAIFFALQYAAVVMSATRNPVIALAVLLFGVWLNLKVIQVIFWRRP